MKSRTNKSRPPACERVRRRRGNDVEDEERAFGDGEVAPVAERPVREVALQVLNKYKGETSQKRPEGKQEGRGERVGQDRTGQDRTGYENRAEQSRAEEI